MELVKEVKNYIIFLVQMIDDLYNIVFVFILSLFRLITYIQDQFITLQTLNHLENTPNFCYILIILTNILTKTTNFKHFITETFLRLSNDVVFIGRKDRVKVFFNT